MNGERGESMESIEEVHFEPNSQNMKSCKSSGSISSHVSHRDKIQQTNTHRGGLNIHVENPRWWMDAILKKNL